MRTRRVLVGIALAASLVGACTSDEILQSLAPFPCAKDNTCPSGYSCEADAGGCIQSYLSSSGGGLTEKPLDSVCSGNDYCKNGDCVFGVCVPFEQTGNGTNNCDQGRALVSANCFLACSSSCPSGLTCAWVQGGPYSDVPTQVCISQQQAQVLNSPCSMASPCGVYGSIGPYSCEDGECVLRCQTNSTPCPPGLACTSPAGDNMNGCFASD